MPNFGGIIVNNDGIAASYAIDQKKKESRAETVATCGKIKLNFAYSSALNQTFWSIVNHHIYEFGEDKNTAHLIYNDYVSQVLASVDNDSVVPKLNFELRGK